MGKKDNLHITEYISEYTLRKEGKLPKISHDEVASALEEYLKKVITDITRDKLIDFQIELSDEELITDYDWSFEDKANEFLLGNKID